MTRTNLSKLREEVEARLGDGESVPDHGDLPRVIHELRVHQAELEIQNEELRRVELELLASRDRYRALYDQAPIGYATLDAVGRVANANQTLCRRLGCEPAWLRGRPLSSLMHEAHADAFHLHLRSVLNGDERQICEVELRHTSGARVQTRLESSASRGILAERGQVLTAVIDLTALRQAEHGARAIKAENKTLLDTTLDGILTLDAERRIESINAAALRMFGYDAGELRGRPARVLLPPSPPGSPPGCAERYLTSGRCDRSGSEPVVVQGRRRDGTEIPLELGLGPWHDDGAAKLTVLLRDITERRLAEQRLRDSEALLREIVTHVDDVLYMREHGGRLTFVSPAYDAIWGRPARIALADPKGWLDSIDPRDTALVDRAHEQLMHGDPIDVEYRILRPDGTTRWIRDHASAVRDATGTTRRYVGVARDITKERELEDELRQASKMDAVNTLAAGIAHDFRNLLHGIAGCVTVAERYIDEPQRAQPYLGQIRDATRRGAALTDQLTNFSRRQDGDQRQPLVLDALIEDTAPLLMRLMGEQIRVVLQLDTHKAVIAADPVQIERILLNLASNASDAMPSGGTLVIHTESVTVDERDSRPHTGGVHGRCVKLEVRDTGTGMDDATRERIFEPFFTTKDFGKGTGMGLAAVFGITHKLGGHVAVDSAPGVGTTFTFWLPRTTETRPREVTGPHPIPALSSTALLVEDDPLVRMAIRGDLESLGMHVVEARDPRHALSLVDMLQPPPALLISDVMMPDMTGPRLAKELCARVPGLRVLLVSAHSTEELLARGTVPPGIAVLRKPFDKNTLGRRVLEVLGAAIEDAGPTEPIPIPIPPASPAPAARPAPARSSGTILLVDDDENGRMALAMLLEDEGMTVLAAADPAEALQLAASSPEPIALLITDLNLPQLRGDALARRLLAAQPEPPELLYLSGQLPPEDLDPKGTYVLKPIELDRFVAQIQELLGRRDRG